MNAELAIRRLQAVVRRQHKALSTEETYVYWLRRYMAALPRYPATMTSEQKVERFLSDLVRYRDISVNQLPIPAVTPTFPQAPPRGPLATPPDLNLRTQIFGLYLVACPSWTGPDRARPENG
ncbi:MAG: phage integrase N-terminal SAM-like domain-containing protein [Limisphaerales bacterium]